MSDIRYICIKRSSLHWRYGAALAIHGIKSWQMHTHAHCSFPQCPSGNQVLSTSTRSSSKKIHATACSGIHMYIYIYIYNNGDRQIGFGEKRKFLAKPDLSHHRKGFHLFKFVNIECMPDLTHWLGPNGNRQCRLAKFWQMVSQQTLHQTPLR